MGRQPGVALTTYSTKPRGGVVHTLSLAQALHRQGCYVHVVALGDPGKGFFRPVDVPHTIVPAPQGGETLEERVFAAIDAIADWLDENARRFRIVHTQDCISCRAAARVRDAGAPITVLRTVHHVDDFTTPALINCQHQAIVEPDGLVVVSEQWRSILRSDYQVDATVIHNGVDPARFGPIDRRAPRPAAGHRRRNGPVPAAVGRRRRAAQGLGAPVPGPRAAARADGSGTGAGRGRR